MDWESMPPSPDAPPEWEPYAPARDSFAEPDPIVQEPDRSEETRPSISNNEPATGNPGGTELSPSLAVKSQTSIEAPAALVTSKPPAVTGPAKLEEEHAPQMVTVSLRPSGDPQRDIRRISRLHGTFISYPGKDRFAFQIFEEGRGHLIEFPNDTTHLCAELAARIKEAVGEENLRIEPILYQ